MRKFSWILLLAFSSCTGYRQNFDCPPGRGVPCTSVSDIEALIIETEEGPDVFLPEERPKAPYLQGKIKLNKNNIWIPETQQYSEGLHAS